LIFDHMELLLGEDTVYDDEKEAERWLLTFVDTMIASSFLRVDKESPEVDRPELRVVAIQKEATEEELSDFSPDDPDTGGESVRQTKRLPKEEVIEKELDAMWGNLDLYQVTMREVCRKLEISLGLPRLLLELRAPMIRALVEARMGQVHLPPERVFGRRHPQTSRATTAEDTEELEEELKEEDGERPFYGKPHNNETKTLQEFLQEPFALKESKTSGYTYRHRPFNMVEKLDRAYFSEGGKE